METKKLEMYIAPEVECIECELESAILGGSVESLKSWENGYYIEGSVYIGHRTKCIIGVMGLGGCRVV